MLEQDQEVWHPSVYGVDDVVGKRTNKPVYRPEILETISEAIDALDEKLRELSVEIHGMSLSIELARFPLTDEES